MNKIFMTLCTLLATFGFAISTAQANVIYDVVVEYNYPSTTQYSFSMEFLDDVGIKTEADLISVSPSFDFIDEQLSHSGNPWDLLTDNPTIDLSFDPNNPLNIIFESTDIFTEPGGVDAILNFKQNELWYWINYDGGGVTHIVPYFGMVSSVTKRGVSVPEPSSLLLMGIGLAGLGFVRLRKQS